MKKPELSIIIPTYNEEDYLPILLQSIKAQSFKDYEVIVADANSTDNTRKIAQKFGCKVATGGLPAVGRNRGAKKSTGDILMFLDSDVQLTKDFLRKMLETFSKDGLVCATGWSKSMSSKFLDRAFFFLTNISITLLSPFRSRAPGWCIMVKRDVFGKIGGFDEKIRVSEDANFTEQTKKYGRFKVVRKADILVSARRLEKEGRIRYAWKILKITFFDLIGKKLVDEKHVKYDFSGYK